MNRARIVLFALTLGCGSQANDADGQEIGEVPSEAAPVPTTGQRVAIFAGGCFWCMEPAFESIPGVAAVDSGYTGGREPRPTYHDVGYGRTHHLEAVRVVYDPNRVTFDALLEVFWRNIDPTQSNGQFCDRGEQYRSAIFVASADERRRAEAARASIAARLGRSVDTRVLDAQTFWLAEDYHQNYYRTHANDYRRYRDGCGRDRRLRELWGDAAASH